METETDIQQNEEECWKDRLVIWQTELKLVQSM